MAHLVLATFGSPPFDVTPDVWVVGGVVDVATGIISIYPLLASPCVDRRSLLSSFHLLCAALLSRGMPRDL